MSSKRKTRRRKTGKPASNSEVSLSASAAATFGVAALCAAGSAEAGHPPLPTPCVTGNCGNSPSSTFVTYGSAGASVSGTTLNVTQTTSKAVLNWADFNIASGYTVNFLQPNAASAALNKIWSADPSQIAGKLNANGQVYLINQNGIIFSNGAQVNVGGLIASTLPFADNNTDSLFINGFVTPAGSSIATTAFQVATDSNGNILSKGLTVSPGASLTAQDVNGQGGRIMLLGTAVTNQGTISTPDGQTILGAGKSVALLASGDASLRGLLIELNLGTNQASQTGQQSQNQSPYTVENDGTITAARGNVSLASLIVNQAGIVSATTSVAANGSITLDANDHNGGTGGTVTLEPGSTTEVLPDSTDTATVTEGNLSSVLTSSVNLQGQTIALQGNALIRAPGGNVSLQASATGNTQTGGGRIYLDSGSTIDVSGLTNVPVPVTNEILQVTLESNDLADDPLLRNGLLHGLTVTVNANQGSTLFNVAPYVANIPVGIEQVLTQAGTINLTSGGDVIARAGSTLNVSGGSVAYQGGNAPATTKLLGADGKVYDISNAPSNAVQYVGVANSYSYTDPTWGTKSDYTAQTYYAGYIQGANAGAIQVEGPSGIYLRGTMLGQTVIGPFQRTSPPLGGEFIFGCQAVSAIACQVNGSVNYETPGVIFSDDTQDVLGSFDYTDTNVTLPYALANVATLSPTQLTQNGFDRISVNSNGAVTLPGTMSVSMAPGGSFGITSLQQINIGGQIRAPGGTVSLTTDGAASGTQSPQNIALSPGAVLDVSGNWTNDSLLVTPTPGTGPVVPNGGSVSISAQGNVLLANDTRIDVSGGGWVNNSNQLTKGTAGKIAIAASYVPTVDGANLGTVQLGTGTALVGDSLSASGGGTLSIASGSVTVGSSALGAPGELVLQPSFFANRGFSSYSISAQNSLVIGSTDPTDNSPIVIAPQQETLVFTQNMLLKPTGSDLSSFTDLELLPASLRSPANISFSAADGLLLGQNATIVTDPLGTVSLKAGGGSLPGIDPGSLTVLGSVIAPAGSITLQLAASSGTTGYFPDQQLLLGPQAVLAAPAYAQIDTLDPQGYREGSVLAGGSVSLTASTSFVVTKPGSVIDVSGASGVIDVVGSNGVVPTTVAGSAGSILIDAGEGIVLQSTLRGQPATSNGQPIANAQGGTLTVSLLDPFGYSTRYNYDTNPSNLNPYPLTPRVLTLSSQPASSLSTFPQSGVAQISTQTISAGGFDAVSLESSDIIAFDGQVSLSTRASLTLDAPLLQGNPGSSTRLSSAYVALGDYLNSYEADYFTPNNPNSPPSPDGAIALSPGCATPAQCTATLLVNAGSSGAQGLVDIRGVSGWTGFSSEIIASTGDIRLTSAQNATVNANPAPLDVVQGDTSPANLRAGLNTSGALTLQAQQVYPTTDTDFTLGAATSVTIKLPPGTTPGSLPATPLSAGGILAINAPSITQDGVLRAPMGEITLHGIDTTDLPGQVVLGAGSVTSVSADGAVIPYGSTVNGQQWTYSPIGGVQTQVFTAPPAKDINLNASDVTISTGATVDLSGGGDLYAYEWIAGPGGSKDILNTPSAYTYAILPQLGSSFAPIDAQYQQSSPSVGPNQTIYLSGVPGLAAGTYALLPARYALLPGAYAIQVVKTNSNILSGSASAQPNGSYITSGQFGVAGTDILSSQTSTVLVAPSSVVNSQSQYTASYANTFFTGAASASQTAVPRLPADAGELQLTAETQVILKGAINFAPGSFVSGTDANGKPITQQGAGGDVSIQAPTIQVVDSGTSRAALQSGALQLDAQSLDNLGAQTLVLGASVQNTTAGEEITAGVTTKITLDNSAVALQGPDIILAAQNSVTLDSGARISGTGTLNQSPTTLVVNEVGALLRATSGTLAPVALEPSTASDYQPTNPAGVLQLGAGASVAATGSVLLYSTGNTQADPTVSLAAPGLGIFSSRVSLGDVPTGANAPNGLNLTPQLLGQLSGLNNLTIGSTSTIDFYGAVQLGTSGSGQPALSNITLDAWAVDGYGAGDKILQAGSVSFANSNLGSAPQGNFFANNSAPSGTGALTLNAVATDSSESGQITLGAGTKYLAGFSSVSLQAQGNIEGQGTGTLNVGYFDNTLAPQATQVSLTMQSASLVGASASDQRIIASGAVTLTNAAASQVSLPATPIGGKIEIDGASIAQNGNIDLPAGVLILHATAGDVTLGAGSATSAAGVEKSFTVTDSVAAGGQISLLSDTGNVTLANGATVDVSGISSADGKESGGAGSLSVYAPNGDFNFAGSTVKGGAPAGQVQGSFTLNVGSFGAAGFQGLDTLLSNGGFHGALSLETQHDSFVTISDTIQASSFQLSVDNGGINLTSTATINTSGGNGVSNDGGTIALWAGDSLSLQPGAQLLANAGAAGPVAVNGTALSSHGGNVTLGVSQGGAIDLAPGSIIQLGGTDGNSNGTLTLRAPVINSGTDVAVTEIGSKITGTNAPIQVIVEGYNLYNVAAAGTLSQGTDSPPVNDVYTNLSTAVGGLMFNDAATLVGNATAITSRLLPNPTQSGINLQVQPGIEVRDSGDLTLSNTWDLNSWSTALGGTPVNLTLRAQGNLVFNGSLSDGFQNTSTNPWTWTFPTTPIESGSYRLTAGANLGAADPLAVIPQALPNTTSAGAPTSPNAPNSAPINVPGSGNVIVAPDTLIRTGDGNIDIAAGGDVLLGYNITGNSGGMLQVQATEPLNSVIYTAGVPSPAVSSSLFSVPSAAGGGRGGGTAFTAAYPTDGGDVTVSAAGDIQSAPSAQLVTDWQWRRGSSFIANPNATTSPTWWIMFSDFDQGIGALGGGDVSLTAGRDIVNVSAVIPTTGRLLVTGGTPTLQNLLIGGGGTLQVEAGGDVKSGVFENDWGNTAINAGGALTSGATLGDELANQPPNSQIPTSSPVFPVLLTASGSFDVSARAGATINFVGDSTVLPEANSNATATGRGGVGTYFYTYASGDTLTVTSAGGDVILENESINLPIGLASVIGSYTSPYQFANGSLIYPPTLSVAALSGDIDVLPDNSPSWFDGPAGAAGGIGLFPSSSGNLSLLANGSITSSPTGNLESNSPVVLTMYETDPTLWPASVLVPAPTLFSSTKVTAALPQTPLHANDSQLIYVVAETGSIAPSQITFPKAADVVAGMDILDLAYTGKNLNPSDVTLIEAGRNITYSSPTDPVSNALLANSSAITLGGPGYLEVLAGGTINLGDSGGLVTDGNLSDVRLPSTGASIVVGAGFGTNASGGLRPPDYTDFINNYLAPDSSGNPSAYAAALTLYMQELYPGNGASPSYSAALAAFRNLTPAQQLPLLSQVLSDELSETGLAHTLLGANYDRGYTAINTLFPTKDSQGSPLTYQGDLDMFFSQIKTAAGGDVKLLVPGGSVVVGVPNPPASLTDPNSAVKPQPSAAYLGILVIGAGSIEGFANESFEVNQSRILTLEGGDIILWASNGDIDAGKGAKAATGAPPPTVSFNPVSGTVVVNASNAVSGSGIGQLLTVPGIKAGLVNLIAPKGTINAGDAGIRVAGNLNLAAVRVIGANNISVSGTATGVPTSEAGALSGALSGANAVGDAGKNAVDQLSNDLTSGANLQQLSDSLVPTFIIVRAFCIGLECDVH